MIPPFDPTPAQLADLAAQAGLGAVDAVHLVKRHNDVWRLHTSAGSFYLKAYTKPWYGDAPAATGACVQRETTAHRLLAALGLPGPELRWASAGTRLLGRPALLLGGLAGQPLTAALADHPAQAPAMFHAVGAYLARMHARTFRFPGPLDRPGGPTSAPDPQVYQHPYWSPQAMAGHALADLERARLPHALAAELVRRLDDLYGLAPARPRFIHGDCHAHQFFVRRARSSWAVTGVLDLEVASAGEPDADLMKLALELRAFKFDWWTPLCAGYGAEPAWSSFKLWLLAAGEPSWQAHGPLDWPAELRRVLDATTPAKWLALL